MRKLSGKVVLARNFARQAGIPQLKYHFSRKPNPALRFLTTRPSAFGKWLMHDNDMPTSVCTGASQYLRLQSQPHARQALLTQRLEK
jgi:hypothetical protein